MTKRITIIMDGGVIQDILDIPEGIEIEVRDYDVCGTDFEEGRVLKDSQDESYVESIWEAQP